MADFAWDISPVQFVVLALLSEKGCSSADVNEHLRKLGWKANKSAAYAILRNFETAGLITSQPADVGRDYELTTVGFDRFRAAVEFFTEILDKSAIFAGRKRSEFAKPGKGSQRKPRVERPPTVLEISTILQHAPPAFANLFRLSLSTGVSIYDLASADAAGVDLEENVLTLPEVSVSGRAIENRRVTLNDESARIVREAVSAGETHMGKLFRTTRGANWTLGSLGTTFRRIRRKAGLPEEIVLSGRGGHLEDHR